MILETILVVVAVIYFTLNLTIGVKKVVEEWHQFRLLSLPWRSLFLICYFVVIFFTGTIIIVIVNWDTLE
jgi:hypothetical protein